MDDYEMLDMIELITKRIEKIIKELDIQLTNDERQLYTAELNILSYLLDILLSHYENKRN